jgi:preprotein translocase subunit SecG
MAFWTNIIIIVHVLVALAIIGLVLLQHGKGADMGSGFGGGSAGSLFGASGSANFLSRATAVLATVFFLLSLGLAYLATNRPKESGGIMDRPVQQAPQKGVESKKDVPAAEAQKSAPGAEAQKSAPGTEPQKTAPAEPAKDKNVPQ